VKQRAMSYSSCFLVTQSVGELPATAARTAARHELTGSAVY
jgi:hypothetical protein